MKRYKLKTEIGEVVEYEHIRVEVSEDITVPEKTETKVEIYTPEGINYEIDSLDVQIAALTAQKAELETVKSKVKIEADKVTGAIVKN